MIRDLDRIAVRMQRSGNPLFEIVPWRGRFFTPPMEKWKIARLMNFTHYHYGFSLAHYNDSISDRRGLAYPLNPG